MPTHGIGKYKHLLPKEAPKKKKERQQMKQIKTATDAEYGTLNVKVSGYALPTKSTEVMVMPEQGTKMYVDAILKTHERIVQFSQLNATLCPIFMEVMLKNQPEGVQLSVKPHTGRLPSPFQGTSRARGTDGTDYLVRAKTVHLTLLPQLSSYFFYRFVFFSITFF
ncbi:large ribosomal subunit protein mL48-like isoform X2 [Salvelinus alpinus]|uniref:large ribosomal subunit protein mL48-like isoform X2 n=1 Tax=Salvelinus alpinus TaxID=8036 RepID=UPI0039FD5390